MEITVNGEAREIEPGTTVGQLIDEMGLAERRLAVEVNREIIPRSACPGHELEAGDRVEIVHAIGGGAARPGGPA